MSTQLLLWTLVIVNIPLYIKLNRIFYRDSEEFKQALLFVFRPDIFSLIKGEYWEDVTASMKAGLYFIICVAIVFLEFLVVKGIVEWFGYISVK